MSLSTGGIRQIYLALHSQLNNYTIEDGQITMLSGITKFYKVNKYPSHNIVQRLDKNIGFDFKSNLVISFPRKHVNQSNVNFIRNNNWIGIIEDNNGLIWVIGLDHGFRLISDDSNTDELDRTFELESIERNSLISVQNNYYNNNIKQ